MDVSMKPVEAFYLTFILKSIPTDKLELVNGSRYKAATKRRKVVETLEEANKDFEDKAKKASEIKKEYVAKMQEYQKEFNELFEKDKKEAFGKIPDTLEGEEKKKAEEEVLQSFVQEKNEEITKYSEELNDKMVAQVKEETGLQFLILKTNGNTFELVDFAEGTESEDVTFQFAEGKHEQLPFVKDTFEKNALDVFPHETLVIQIGEKLGVE